MIDIAVTRRMSGPEGEMQLRFETKISPGEFVAIYGPSGAGKTSVLRILAGLLKPDAGHIIVDRTRWYDSKKKIILKPQLRSIGMVFQEYSLFPNMTVRSNLAFALDKGASADPVDELLDIMELNQLQHQKPALLSGGQKQRVALARALIRRPRLLLLDEPLSALDSAMQSRLQDYILRIHSRFNLTTIMVSHDLQEVIKMSKRVLVLEGGIISKEGAPLAVFPSVIPNSPLGTK